MTRSERFRQQSVRLKLRGLSYARIGKRLKISRQRAQQVVKPTHMTYQLVLSRSNGKCEECGAPVEQGHVHHLRADEWDFNNECNLLVVCKSCHRILHRKDKWPRVGVLQYRGPYISAIHAVILPFHVKKAPLYQTSKLRSRERAAC